MAEGPWVLRGLWWFLGHEQCWNFSGTGCSGRSSLWGVLNARVGEPRAPPARVFFVLWVLVNATPSSSEGRPRGSQVRASRG